ncbi:phosphotransferase [Fodinicurvata sediminis]|uniref:phosphotransferase n=1 Tax=Fodinicurvata sediminis TaxID=1121832 RepID=UPI0003B61AC4|nr:phosphotransferase [Fodinicurvata sediminis]
MRKFGEASDNEDIRLEGALQAFKGDEVSDIQYDNETVPVASPIRRATDWAGYRVETSSGPVWAKVLYEDMIPHVDFQTALQASTQAAKDNLAPEVLAHDPDKKVILFEYLGSPWKWCRVNDLQRIDRIGKLINSKRAFHKGMALNRERDIFKEVQELLESCNRQKVELPEDIEWLKLNIGYAEQAVEAAGRDRAPVHGDGAASNVMRTPEGEIKLLDFDSAGNSDPYFDVATTLVELCEFDDEWEQAVELVEGKPRRDVLARCRLYAIADDIRWGLWGLCMATSSPRKDIEFFKYGQWRLLRGRYSLHDSRFEAWLRQV